jgi:SAM-dependent methyltransferase
MPAVQRAFTFMLSALKGFGPSNLKKYLWDKEYSGDKWVFADNTIGDCVYPHLEKHVRNGSLLDLGCGTNTANELAASAYQRYVGVDISDSCLSRAAHRTREIGRAEKNSFVQGDFINYVPKEKFDAILFRESMYHVPFGKIEPMLERYANYLRGGGVFIVRLKTSAVDGNAKARPTAMIDVIESAFDVVEKCEYPEAGSTVIVFRSRRQAASESSRN